MTLPGVRRTTSTMNGISGTTSSMPTEAAARSKARFANRLYVRWWRWRMLMNQPEVRCRIGTQPNTCSKKCVTPTTLKPLDATSSSDSSARPEPVPSVRTIRSGRCASTMAERSATFPSTGTPSVGEARSESSTMPTTLNGTSAACSALSARSLAQALVPTTSTRRFAANCRRQAASQSVDRLKTETDISASVDSASSAPRSGSQKLSAETTIRPVMVPTAAGTAAPSVNGTARNALRTVNTQTAATSEETATVASGEELCATV